MGWKLAEKKFSWKGRENAWISDQIRCYCSASLLWKVIGLDFRCQQDLIEIPYEGRFVSAHWMRCSNRENEAQPILVNDTLKLYFSLYYFDSKSIIYYLKKGERDTRLIFQWEKDDIWIYSSMEKEEKRVSFPHAESWHDRPQNKNDHVTTPFLATE